MSQFSIDGTFELYNGIKMPYLGLGVWQCENNDEVINAVTWALDAGYRHIDTAAIYKNEEGVGKAVNDHSIDRSSVFVTSKVWNADQGYDSTMKAFDTSMSKLGFDYLDLYLIHWPVAGKFQDTWRALNDLYKQGRVKAIGVSNFLRHHLEELAEASDVTPMVNQLEFHPRLIQENLHNYCIKNGIQYEAWSPLMQGKVFEIDILKGLSLKYEKTLAQIVLRWNLQKGVVTIPKSSQKERIETNAQIFDFELSEQDMAMIESLDQASRVGPDPDNFDF